MPGRAGQGRVKVEIVCGWGGVAWRGVGFGRVGKGRVVAGIGRGGIYGVGYGWVGWDVGLGWWGRVTSTTKPQFYHTLLNPISTPTPTSPLPFPPYITLSY